MAKKSKRLKDALNCRDAWLKAQRDVTRTGAKLTEAKAALTEDERREYDKITTPLIGTGGL